jgi:hypothetical protein
MPVICLNHALAISDVDSPYNAHCSSIGFLSGIGNRMLHFSWIKRPRSSQMAEV